MSALKVALVTINFMSDRRATTLLKTPKRICKVGALFGEVRTTKHKMALRQQEKFRRLTSELRERSCASSMTIALQGETFMCETVRYGNQSVTDISELASQLAVYRTQALPIFVDVWVAESFPKQDSICHVLDSNERQGTNRMRQRQEYNQDQTLQRNIVTIHSTQKETIWINYVLSFQGSFHVDKSSKTRTDDAVFS